MNTQNTPQGIYMSDARKAAARWTAASRLCTALTGRPCTPEQARYDIAVILFFFSLILLYTFPVALICGVYLMTYDRDGHKKYRK